MEESLSSQLSIKNTSPRRKQSQKNYTNLRNNQRKNCSLMQLHLSTLDKKKNSFKMIELLLKPSSELNQTEVELCVQSLKEEGLFSEISNDRKIMKALIRCLNLESRRKQSQLFQTKEQMVNLYKIIKGVVLVKKSKEDSCKVKGEGQFVVTPEQLQIGLAFQATCKENCIFLKISYQSYQMLLSQYQDNKHIKQMLGKSPLFSYLKRRQIAFLFDRSEQFIVKSKQRLFAEKDDPDGKCYYVIQGELMVMKQNKRGRDQVVCYVAQNSFVGEEVLFTNEKRSYSAFGHSNQTKVVCIYLKDLEATIEQFKLIKQSLLTSSYRKFLQLRQMHYDSKLTHSIHIQQSFHQVSKTPKMSPLKSRQMNNIIRGIENSSIQLGQKQKLLEKRMLLGKQQLKYSDIISVDKPLFVKEDFPGLRKYVKRAHIIENRVKEGGKLPNLY